MDFLLQSARLIGTGTFGCGSTIVEGEDFIAENITFENSSPQVILVKSHCFLRCLLVLVSLASHFAEKHCFGKWAYVHVGIEIRLVIKLLLILFVHENICKLDSSLVGSWHVIHVFGLSSPYRCSVCLREYW